LKIIVSKFSNWYFEWYKKSDHPELVAIRNIISRNTADRFILIGEGDKYNHFSGNGIHFYNVGKDNSIQQVLSTVLKMELVCILRPHVIASFGTTNIIPFGLASFFTRARFIPVIPGEISYAINAMPLYTRKITQLFLKIVFRRAFKILVLGTSVSYDLVTTYGVDRRKIFRYRYKVSDIFNSKASKELKPILNPQGPIVLTVCRISPEKGLEYLIEASKTVSKEFPKVKIIVIGFSGKDASPSEKQYYDKLNKTIKQNNLERNFIILEKLSHLSIPNYLSVADIFVLPSLSEGLPLAILEALATGVPVVATLVGGIPDLLEDGRDSILIKPGNSEELSKAILKLLSNDNLRKVMGEKGLATMNLVGRNEIEHALERFIFDRFA
jgi:glycosyltransferase involved in cell wall biosynthesis